MTVFRPTGDVVPAGDGSTSYDAVVVSTGPGWADDDDSTYASLDGGDMAGRVAIAKADFTEGTFAGVSALNTYRFGKKVANINPAAGLDPADNAGFVGLSNFTTWRLTWQYQPWSELVEGWNYSPVFDYVTYPGFDFAATGPESDLSSATGLFAYVQGPTFTAEGVHMYDVLEWSLEIIPVAQGGMWPLRRHPRPGVSGPGRNHSPNLSRRPGTF